MLFLDKFAKNPNLFLLARGVGMELGLRKVSEFFMTNNPNLKNIKNWAGRRD